MNWLGGRWFLSASQLDHSDSDCFGCAILSYGIEGRVYATDGMLPLDVLIVPFKGDKCPMLVGKPKLFFLQVWHCLFIVTFQSSCIATFCHYFHGVFKKNNMLLFKKNVSFPFQNSFENTLIRAFILTRWTIMVA